jgi:hypothetical protein
MMHLSEYSPCRWTRELSFPMPTMLFGQNQLLLKHGQRFTFNIDCKEALLGMDPSTDLKVPVAEQWKATRYADMYLIIAF